MGSKTVYQTDRNGFFRGITEADECQLESGVYHMPAGCVEEAPPEQWGEGEWPRWVPGTGWVLANQPRYLKDPAAAETNEDAISKLRAFLTANPDVAALLNTDGGANV